MARLARIVVPLTPHHVTQRGNRRMAIFKHASDFALYRDLLAERLKSHAVTCSAYCLMPNHVHLLLSPMHDDAAAAGAALSRSVGEAHRRYTAFFNARARTTGHLFQSRFGCVAMDEAHWLTAVRYLAFNPVRAGLCRRPEDWRWKSLAKTASYATLSSVTAANNIGKSYCPFVRPAGGAGRTFAPTDALSSRRHPNTPRAGSVKGTVE